MSKIDQEDVDRLQEIKDQMLELLDEAQGIVKKSGNRFQIDRMKSYWHPHIQMALTDDHFYLGKDGATMEDTISALEGMVEGDEEEDEAEVEEVG